MSLPVTSDDLATVPSPSYSEKHQDIILQFDNLHKSLTPEEQDKVLEKITEHLDSPDFRSMVLKDMDRLPQIAVTIKNDFFAIEGFVVDLDNAGVTKDKKFGDEWKHLHQEYTNLVQTSKATAHEVKAHIAGLRDDLLSVVQDEASGLTERKLILRGYKLILRDHMKGLKGDKEKAEATEQLCRHLFEGIRSFEANLRFAVNGQYINGMAAINELNTKISGSFLVWRLLIVELEQLDQLLDRASEEDVKKLVWG
ncbi:hypothetical protein B0H12DRAFT_1231729 [Mycena haematopus]|nr:hypothetical protein B0H12DRAFT_1231729 [Mycena haematopus]